MEAAKDALTRVHNGVIDKFIKVVKPPDHICHYCSASTVKKILSAGTLWASDVFLERASAIRGGRNLQGPVDDAFMKQAYVYLTALICRLKNPSFSRESEWRLLVAQTKDRCRFPVRERCGKSGKVAYVEFPICTKETISEIVLGPNCSMNEKEVSELLSAAKLDGVPLRRSEDLL